MKKNDLKTVCLALGPYRNLTTLTASLLFLHPRCQVLNHGSDQILPNPDINFLVDYTAGKFDAFVKCAVSLSAEGRRGRHGGSITLSHAFDNKQMHETYNNRFQDTRVKSSIECLFWKESLRVTGFIRHHNVRLGELFSGNEQLRFLMPVRNPVDCALSNIKTGHAQALANAQGPDSYPEVLNAILLEIRWFMDLSNRYPGRFFYYFENDFDRNTVYRLAEFLKLEADPVWVDDVIKNYNIKHSYEYTQGMKDHYCQLVAGHFEAYPDIRKRLESFFC